MHEREEFRKFHRDTYGEDFHYHSYNPTFLSVAKDVKVNSLSLLGSDATVDWQRNSKGIAITAPKELPQEVAIVFKLETEGLPEALVKAKELRVQRSSGATL